MTFSIAGRCARTGMLGAVVTTSSIAVGSRCAFAAAGVGAALTQHTTDPRLGPLMLDHLRRRYTVEQAIGAAVGGTPRSDWRQLAVIDSRGAHREPQRRRRQAGARRGAWARLRGDRQYRALGRDPGRDGQGVRGGPGGAAGGAADRCARGRRRGGRRVQAAGVGRPRRRASRGLPLCRPARRQRSAIRSGRCAGCGANTSRSPTCTWHAPCIRIV